MESNKITMEQAVELFDQQKYQEAFAAFAEIYNQCQDKNEREAIFEMLNDAFYAPNIEELQANYAKNLQTLKRYPYLWEKTFRGYEELPFQLFPVSDEHYYCYSKEKDCFFGEYDAKTRYQMRYFFEDLDKPLKVENEDNFYNLNFLNDNVRASEDYAGDNHIYLAYDSLEPLERLMLTCDLESVLNKKKFVFLIGENNWKRYPINFRKKFGIDYTKMKPKQLKIEEINRIYLNQFYGYSGTDFFEGVLNGSDHILVLNGWFFYESAKDIVEAYLDYMQNPGRTINVSQILDILQKRINDIKLAGWPHIVGILPSILAGRETIAVHEMWKAVMVAAMQVSSQAEGKRYLSRVSPIIFYDPHGVSCSKYYELMKYFKYPAVEATIREPTMRLIRSMQVFGIGGNLDALRVTLRSTYQHSQDIPHWLTDSGFYVAKLEDLKLKSKETLHTICRVFNIPYTEKLLDGKIGMWGVLFTNEKGEQLHGFDQRSVHRDIGDMVPPEDQRRFDLYYWHIHHYFRYPCAVYRPELSQNEVEKIFSIPFRFERVYAAQRAAYQEALKNAAPEDTQKIRDYIEQRYSLDPVDIRALLQHTMVRDCLNGFDPELALPTVMLPEDEMEWPLPQDQRLRLALDARDDQADLTSGQNFTGEPPKVYWLTGLSGAGKTTIGHLWYEKLKESGEAVVFLDGDELRQVFGDDLGFTEADRRKSAMRNARLCALLAKQGITVVCCTISMFDSVRTWNRENIPGYFEVYVKASMETLCSRDQKGLYSREGRDVAGVHFQVEEPKRPDLILENDGQKTPIEQAKLLHKAVYGGNKL